MRVHPASHHVLLDNTVLEKDFQIAKLSEELRKAKASGGQSLRKKKGISAMFKAK